jgi:atypical dual specificity phosphatase
LESPGELLRLLYELIAGRPYRLWSLDSQLAGASKPHTLRALRRLRGLGFDVLISLTPVPPDPRSVRDAGLEHHHIPLRNHEVPSPEDLERLSELIEGEIRRGKRVLVHCSAGQGRTGTVLAYYLWRKRGRAMGEAIALVRRACPGAIEPGQEAFLREREAMGS